MSEYRDRAKAYHRAIKKILIDEWDPIGVSGIAEAQNEYDSYVPAIYKMLISRKSNQDIFDFLWRVETEYMELNGNRQHIERVAARLLEISNEISG